VKEDLALKRRIYDELEESTPARTVIASNTSSFPISVVQEGRRHPERFVGMHWGEPAQIMRYLEIVPGKLTSPRAVRLTKQVGIACGKEPTVLKQDIRGFVSNRMMYAILRKRSTWWSRGSPLSTTPGPVVPQRHRLVGDHRGAVPVDGSDWDQPMPR
jgi:3-hydroxybutyryl-CoA dehydrogenase